MWDFTKERLLNDLSAVSVVTQATDKSIPTNGSGLKIKGHGTFISSHVSPVWKAAGAAAVKEVAQVAVPSITAGVYRFSLPLTFANGGADANFTRYDIDFGKPLDVEFILGAGESLASVATKLQKWYNRYDNQVATKGITVTASGGNLIFTAPNEYIRFGAGTIKIAKYDATLDQYVPFNTAASTVTTPGATGVGTAWTLLQNFRIPTQAATYITAENLDERPIAGTLYNQYTFRYTANRNIHGTGVLGEVASSVTTHVFYVLSTIAASFETLLTSAKLTIVTVPDADTPVDDEQGKDTVVV